MKLDELQARGGLVDAGLVKKKGVWEHDGKKDSVEFFVRRASFGAVDRAFTDKDKSSSSALIVECIRLGDQGEEQLTYEQAYSLESKLAVLFVDAITEVNELAGNKDAPKN